ncbi:MAG TPA: HAMP domain-containing sensor histidine kinase [Acidimicrobiia bacterium]|nr:HAMP domain-containing sensor histidine kinase [Acidimicrobiia bacterium]
MAFVRGRSIDRWIEPLIGAVLVLHGTTLLSSAYEGSVVTWALVALVAVVAASGLVTTRGPVDLRAWLLLATTVGLMAATGGVGSFFALWLFILAPLYGALMRTPWSVVYPLVAGAVYLSMVMVQHLSVPLPVVMGRTFAYSGIGVVLAILTERSSRVAEELQRLSDAKDSFVAAVSHELRTPLTAVVGMTSVLADDATQLEPGEIAEFAATVHRQAVEVSDIVEDLLVAARADIGRVSVVSGTVELSGLLSDVVDELVGRGMGTVVVDGAERVTVVADDRRLRQILRNLLVNAHRYGGDEVCVRVTNRGTTAMISVEDDGPGLSWTERTSSFEPFAHHQPLGSQPESVGLGLYVSSRLAQMMDGSLEYRRAAGTTSFVVEMPLAVD